MQVAEVEAVSARNSAVKPHVYVGRHSENKIVTVTPPQGGIFRETDEEYVTAVTQLLPIFSPTLSPRHLGPLTRMQLAVKEMVPFQRHTFRVGLYKFSLFVRISVP